jgi:uncharacterized protein involved in response to NO
MKAGMHGSLLLGTAPARDASRVSLLAKGFRPFFLLAAAYAIAIVPLWLGVLNGLWAPGPYLDPSVWHAHEMLSGFVSAVVAGFLLTAVGNWTQRETATGSALAVLALLWLAGRVAMLAPSVLPPFVAAAIDLAFLPALIFALARPLIATGNRRNFVMLGVLAALFATRVVVHGEGLELVTLGWGRRANLTAVDLIALLLLIIGGRVFPMFTRNATGVATIRSLPVLDRACVSTMVLLCVADVALPQSRALIGGLATLVGLLAAARAVHWGTLHARRDPLLWILHAGYGWLVLALLLRGLGLESPATHALTVGAIGSLTLGMMSRVALGHTGRMLAAPRGITLAFVAITLSALARVLVPLLVPAFYRAGLVVAGLAWTASFAIFLKIYAPVLLAPRVDGRPG